MSNSDIGRIPKLLPNNLLHHRIRLIIQRSRRLIQHNNARTPHERPRKGEQLSLALRKVGPPTLHHRVQRHALGPFAPLLPLLGEPTALYGRPQCRVVVLIIRIKIAPQRAREQCRILRDEGDARSEGVEVG